MKSIIKTLALGVLLIGGIMLASPASATHTYTYNYCDGRVFDPTNGEEVVEYCYTYTRYNDTGCSNTRNYYKIAGVSVTYSRSYYCDGNSWTCYSALYVDTSPARVGLC